MCVCVCALEIISIFTVVMVVVMCVAVGRCRAALVGVLVDGGEDGGSADCYW